ncbi:MAG: ATP-binding protein, partial [Mycoplasmataceae bacterium]|nr:ATP-binding protein [Mycoplasmataceae bacterium]
VMLNKNYRSASASLMSFSAKNFYESELDVINSATAKDGDAIQVVNVEGIWTAGVNKVEVEEIIKLATKNIDKYEKVIILAFNSAQRVLIEKVIIERKPKLFKALRQEKLLIRNIENIQGDEADLVLISVVYTPKTNVGSTYVARAGGRNALNVALSRAKEKMIIVKSVGFDTIREAKSEDFKTFKEWLRFLDLEVIEQREYSLIKDKLKVENDNEDYNLKEDIFEDLTESFKAVKNVKVVKDYPIGSKSIDVALVNSTGNIIMGIEADTYEYSNVKGFDGYLEDISRFEFLEVKGYSMFRVKLYEWLLERNKVVRQLKAKLKQLRK